VTDHGEQAGELAAVEQVGERLPLLRGAQHLGGVAVEVLILEQEAEEALQGRDRARLAAERRPPLRLVGEEGTQIERTHRAQFVDPARLEEA
jgi:hypothetical protein